MKKIIVVAAILLGACNPVQTNTKDSEYMVDVMKTEGANKFEVVCLDGVQYWVNMAYGQNNSVLAPRINEETLLPARCPQVIRAQP